MAWREREGENPVPHYWEHVLWVWGHDDVDAFISVAEAVTLEAVVEQITCPLLITHGVTTARSPFATPIAPTNRRSAAGRSTSPTRTSYDAGSTPRRTSTAASTCSTRTSARPGSARRRRSRRGLGLQPAPRVGRGVLPGQARVAPPQGFRPSGRRARRLHGRGHRLDDEQPGRPHRDQRRRGRDDQAARGGGRAVRHPGQLRAA